MYNLDPEKVTGRHLYRIVLKEVKKKKQAGDTISLTSFCETAGLSKQQLMLYRRGAKPSGDGVLKIARGLKSMGVTVEVQY